jgi:hypothetical protein
MRTCSRGLLRVRVCAIVQYRAVQYYWYGAPIYARGQWLHEMGTCAGHNHITAHLTMPLLLPITLDLCHARSYCHGGVPTSHASPTRHEHVEIPLQVATRSQSTVYAPTMSSFYPTNSNITNSAFQKRPHRFLFRESGLSATRLLSSARGGAADPSNPSVFE